MQLCSEARARTDCHKLRISTGEVTVRQAPRQQQSQTQMQTKPKPKHVIRRHSPSKPKRVRLVPKRRCHWRCCCTLAKDRRRSPTVAECGRSSAELPNDAQVAQPRSTWPDSYANVLSSGPLGTLPTRPAKKPENTPKTYWKHTAEHQATPSI